MHFSDHWKRRAHGISASKLRKKSFHISLKGENKFKAIDLFKNFELQKRFTPGSDQFDADLEIEDETPAFWHLRATQIDNHIAYSSPIWFE